MEYGKVLEDFRKLDDIEKKFLILELLKSKDIKFTELTDLYSKYLELMNKQFEIEKSIFATCLSAQYNKFDDMEFINARSGLILHPFVPTEFITEHILKNVSVEELEKQRKYIENRLKS